MGDPIEGGWENSCAIDVRPKVDGEEKLAQVFAPMEVVMAVWLDDGTTGGAITGDDDDADERGPLLLLLCIA